ncbi:hypothetical protein DMC64_14925 [Amycolatopsis sp. WAC 04197]|uniref:hypothetical protein n=1 Tax=Amycolatopsis sp. WAC 04197 TaxID=2203199 RepID=UPI000F769ECC|nr:hypothetical protein [Amycolatopsis sp. WAC 04197]RSN46033.1 hypothetical protein DMC64_14925 [Amycolatopsis sp. WAC 04197]
MTEPTRPLTVLSQRRRVIRGDASLIVGLPWTTGFQYLVLLAAAAVDIVAFNQILTQAIDEYEEVLWGFVGGFTVVCLALSHTAGKQWKESSFHRHVPNARSIAIGCGGVWLALGLMAFVFRWFYVTPASGGTTVENEGQAPSEVADNATQGNYLSALLFLMLYLGTGVLSGAMAYKLHNPAAQQWVRAVAKRAKAATRLAELEAGLVRAEELTKEVGEIRQRADQDMVLFLALPDSLTAKVLADAELKLLGRGLAVGEHRRQITGEDNQNGKDRR